MQARLSFGVFDSFVSSLTQVKLSKEKARGKKRHVKKRKAHKGVYVSRKEKIYMKTEMKSKDEHQQHNPRKHNFSANQKRATIKKEKEGSHQERAPHSPVQYFFRYYFPSPFCTFPLYLLSKNVDRLAPPHPPLTSINFFYKKLVNRGHLCGALASRHALLLQRQHSSDEFPQCSCCSCCCCSQGAKLHRRQASPPS